MNIVKRFRSLPVKNRGQLGLGLIVALFIALPLFIWAITTQNFNPLNKAQQVQRISVSTQGAPYIGPINAPVTVVEFGDFQCPFCKAFHDTTFQSLLNAYPNQIRFVFRNFPLTQIHPQAEIAAEAAACANEQNKFWEMSDLLFANQDHLTSDDLKGYAVTLGLNATQFNSCLDTSKYSQTIQQDITDGTSYGVTGTPTFFIDGIPLAGAQSLSAFQQIIDSELNPSPTPSPTSSSTGTPTPTPTNSSSPTPTPTPTPTPSPTPGGTATDDVYFVQNQSFVTFTTIGENPNTSISPNDVQLGKTYLVGVNFALQNTLKENYPQATTSAILLVNNYYLGQTPISIPLIAEHRDGASYIVYGVYTATTQNTNVTISFDPNNTYPETNENNNLLSFNFGPSATATPTPTPSPTIGPNTYNNPNSCNGTCGSNANCQANYECYNGYCRNPSCPTDNTCGCNTTPTPTATSTAGGKKTSPTPEIAYYSGTSPSPASLSGQNESFINTPSPTAAPAQKVFGGVNIKYIAIGIFAVIALIFGISVLFGSLGTQKIPEIKYSEPVTPQNNPPETPQVPENPTSPPLPPTEVPQNPV